MSGPGLAEPIPQGSVFSQFQLVQKWPWDGILHHHLELVERLQFDIDSNDEYFVMFHEVQAVLFLLKLFRQTDKQLSVANCIGGP